MRLARAARRFFLAGVLAVALTLPVTATASGQNPPSVSQSRRPSLELPHREDVLTLLETSALAQIAALDRPHVLRPSSITDPTANWVSAAFYTGVTRLARVSGDPELLRFLRRVADHYNYALPGAWTPKNMINADDQAIGELYQELYARTGQAGMLMPLRQRLDYTIPYLTATPEPKRLTWWWCDALFMAPPVMARMSVLTGDPKYVRAMDVQWWRTHDRLWDPQERLYFRDERFLALRSQRGKKIFWSRGVGWVVGGYARVLESMPADFPTRPRYEATLKAMLERLAELQQPDGLWTASLVDPEALPGPESSGSAFNIYAMAWGINHGLLDRRKFLPVVLRGWTGLKANILPNGLLGHVQRTGDQPVPAAREETALYGTGALLLAGLEIMNLSRPVTRLPLAEPPRDLPPRDLPPPQSLAADATLEQRREFERRNAERQAVQDLGFDPAVGN